MAIFDLKDRVVRAVNKRIIVQKAVRPKQSKGGILLPEEDVRVYCEGEVLSVGPKCESGVKPGDHIIWAVFKGQAAGHHDESRWAIDDEDVIGVLEKPTPATCEHSGANLNPAAPAPEAR